VFIVMDDLLFVGPKKCDGEENLYIFVVTINIIQTYFIFPNCLGKLFLNVDVL